MKQPSKIRMTHSMVAFQTFGWILLSLCAAACLLPFLVLVSGSFSSERAISLYGYGLLPKEFTVSAYQMIFDAPETLFRAYGVSILITVGGTFGGLLVTSMVSYVMSRKDFLYRNKLSFFFFFTTLFNGGMISTYIFIIRYLGLKDNFLALILPGMINVFYLLIMRTFFTEVPQAIIESAKIDGAGEFRIFFQLVLPLVKAGLATIGLFLALDYWNDWYSAMLYISKRDKWPLQYMLYDMLSKVQALSRLSAQMHISLVDMPSSSLRLAMTVVATGPIVFVYPFVQKYFVKGIAIGSVKG